MRTGGLSLALTLTLTSFVAAAQGSSSPVSIDVHGAFTSSVVGVESGALAAVELRNRTERALPIEVEIRCRAYRQPERRFRRRVGLGPREERVVLVDLPGVSTNSTYEAVAIVDGDEVAQDRGSVLEQSGPGMVLVLARTPRLVAALSGLQIAIDSPAYGGTSMRDVHAGAPRLSAQSGEFVLPDDLAGFAGVGLVVTTDDELARLEPDVRRTLSAYVETGGRLLVGLARPTGVDSTIVQQFAGTLSIDASGTVTEGQAVAVVGAPRIAYRGRDATPTAYGAVVARGRGAVVVTPFDPNDAALVGDPSVRRLVLSVLATALDPHGDEAVHRFGRGQEIVELGADGMERERGQLPFRYTRSALDVGMSRRPPLLVVGLLLLVYVAAIGPGVSALARRRRNPLLPMAVVPVVAFGFLALLVGIGIFSRGITRRARILQWVDATSGNATAVERSYVGLHVGASGTLRIRGRANERLALVTEPDRGASGVQDQSSDAPLIRDLPMRFWDTVQLRRERVRDLGGGIELVVEDGHVVRVANRSRLTLRDAIVLDAHGDLFTVGTIAPFATADLARVRPVETNVRADFRMYSATSCNHRRILDELGIEASDEALAYGLLGTTRWAGILGEQPTLLARVDLDRSATVPGFTLDASFALLRVVANVAPRLPVVPTVSIDGVPPVAMPTRDADAGTAAEPDGGVDGGIDAGSQP